MTSVVDSPSAPPRQAKCSPIWRIAIVALSIFMALFALPLVGGGVYLLTLGGSPFYALIGIALLTTAVLLWKRRRRAFHLITVVLAITVAWSVWEVGLDGWSLVPRLVCIAVLWLLTAITWPALRPSNS